MSDKDKLFGAIVSACPDLDVVDVSEMVSKVLDDGWVFNVDDSLNYSRLLMSKHLSVLLSEYDEDILSVSEAIVDAGWWKLVTPDVGDVVLAFNHVKLYGEMLVTYFNSACRQAKEENGYFFGWFQSCIYTVCEKIYDSLLVLKISIPEVYMLNVSNSWTDVNKVLDNYLSVTSFGFYEVFNDEVSVNEIREKISILSQALEEAEKVVLYS